MALKLIHYLDYSSQSVSYSPLLDSVGDFTVIEWLCDWAAQYRDVASFHVVATGSRDEEARVAAAWGATVLKTAIRNKIRHLAEFAGACDDADTIALVPPCAPLLPNEVFLDIVRCHAESENGYTIVKGLPLGTFPELYDVSVFESLKRLAVDHGPAEPSYILQRLRQAAKGMAAHDPQLDWLATPTEFDARARYTLPDRLPHSVELRDPDDVARLGRLLKKDRSVRTEFAEASWIQTLCDWNVELVSEIGARVASLRTEAQEVFGRREKQCSAPETNLLFVSNASAYSGAEESLCELIRGLPRRLQASAVVALEGQYTRRLRQIGVNVLCPQRDFVDPTIRNMTYALSVLNRVCPDIVHANGSIGFPFLAAAKMSGVPFVQHVRVASFDGYEEQLQAADVIIAVSEFVKTRLLRRAIDENKVFVIYDGVDVSRFSPDTVDRNAARAQLGISETDVVVLHIGRFAPNKRHDLLIDAVARIAEQVPQLKVFLLGEPLGNTNTYDTTRNAVESLGLQSLVSFCGFIPDLIPYYCAADLLALCSENEPLGTCVLEAMSMRLPVVITESGGLAEVVKPGLTGLIVPPGVPEALGAALVELATDQELRLRMGMNARRFIEENLTIAHCAQRMNGLYRRVAAALRRELAEAPRKGTSRAATRG